MQEQLARLGRRQGGVFSEGQARSAGLTPSWLRRAVQRRDLVVVQPRVYAPAVLPITTVGRLWSVWLSVGAPMAFTGASAATCWGVRGLPAMETADVAVPPNRRARGLRAVRLHRRSLVRTEWRHGLPLVPLAEALVDLAAVEAEPLCRQIVQEVLRLRQCSEPELRNALGRGRAGSARLRAVLAVVADGADSEWERRLAAACVRVGLPPPRRPLLLSPTTGRSIRPDLYWTGVAVEVDGPSVHATGVALLEDLRRQNALVAELGLVVLRYTPVDIRDRLPEVVAEIVAAVEAVPRAGTADLGYRGRSASA